MPEPIFKPIEPLRISSSPFYPGAAEQPLNQVEEHVVHNEIPVETETTRRAIIGGVLGAGAVASWIFEIGPLNEALRTNIGLDVLQNTSSPNAVALTLAAVTMGIETGAATLVAGGLHYAGDGIIEKVRKFKFVNKKFNQIEADQAKESSLGRVGTVAADAVTALGVGAAIVVAKHYVKDRVMGRKHVLARNILKGAAAATSPAIMTGMVGKIAGEAIVAGGEADLGPISEFIVDYGTNNAFWMGVLASCYTVKYGIEKAKAFSASKKERSSVNEALSTKVHMDTVQYAEVLRTVGDANQY